MMFHDVSCFTPTCFMEEISRIDTQLVKKYCRITNPHIHKMAATFLSGYQAKTWRITNRQTFSYSVWYAELRIGILLKVCRFVIRHITQTDTETETELLRRHPPEQTPAWSRHPPCAVHAGRYGQQAGGMHPTGMQSCFFNFYFRCIGNLFR